MKDAEQPKRRGRPPLPADEKKRHTMTFRMRTDLRAAVDELAQANGRSMSEQIEHYVEKGVRTDAGMSYQYGKEPMSSALLKCITGFDKEQYLSINTVLGENNANQEPPREKLVLMNEVRSGMVLKVFQMVIDMLEEMGSMNAPAWITQDFQETWKAIEQIQLKEVERELALRRTEREKNLQAELVQARAEIEAFKSQAPNATPHKP